MYRRNQIANKRKANKRKRAKRYLKQQENKSKWIHTLINYNGINSNNVMYWLIWYTSIHTIDKTKVYSNIVNIIADIEYYTYHRTKYTKIIHYPYKVLTEDNILIHTFTLPINVAV